MSGLNKQKYCNISDQQFRLLKRLAESSAYNRDLEFYFKVGLKSLNRSANGLLEYGFIKINAVNVSATPNRGRRIIEYEITDLGKDMLAVLERINN